MATTPKFDFTTKTSEEVTKKIEEEKEKLISCLKEKKYFEANNHLQIFLETCNTLSVEQASHEKRFAAEELLAAQSFRQNRNFELYACLLLRDIKDLLPCDKNRLLELSLNNFIYLLNKNKSAAMLELGSFLLRAESNVLEQDCKMFAEEQKWRLMDFLRKNVSNGNNTDANIDRRLEKNCAFILDILGYESFAEKVKIFKKVHAHFSQMPSNLSDFLQSIRYETNFTPARLAEKIDKLRLRHGKVKPHMLKPYQQGGASGSDSPASLTGSIGIHRRRPQNSCAATTATKRLRKNDISFKEIVSLAGNIHI